ncbi:hypothetical protein DSECCO2_268110 [anaerobic digester metagenome]
MRVWIEVTGGDWAWKGKCLVDGSHEKRGLKAPATTRYINMLKDLRKGDIVLTHLTSSLTCTKEWQSSIVGISTIVDRYYQVGNTLFVDTACEVQLPVPIKLARYKQTEGFSEEFSLMLRRNFQKYLFEVSVSDLKVLLQIYPENEELIRSSPYAWVLGSD